MGANWSRVYMKHQSIYGGKKVIINIPDDDNLTIRVPMLEYCEMNKVIESLKEDIRNLKSVPYAITTNDTANKNDSVLNKNK
jgi:hypothetical protein